MTVLWRLELYCTSTSFTKRKRPTRGNEPGRALKWTGRPKQASHSHQDGSANQGGVLGVAHEPLVLDEPVDELASGLAALGHKTGVLLDESGVLLDETRTRGNQPPDLLVDLDGLVEVVDVREGAAAGVQSLVEGSQLVGGLRQLVGGLRQLVGPVGPAQAGDDGVDLAPVGSHAQSVERSGHEVGSR